MARRLANVTAGVPRRIRAAAYAALDLLTRRWGIRRRINGRTVRLSGRCFRAFPPVFEKELDRFLDMVVRPGMTVVDAGAHVGVHTVALAQRVGQQGHVYAFEPVPHVAALLGRHVRLNHMLSRVTIVPFGVSDLEGQQEMYVDPTSADPGNSFVRRRYAEATTRIQVRTVTLSSFFEERGTLPDVFKIDTEGYETRVLRGCAGLIRQKPGVVFACALHPWHLRQLGESEEDFFAVAADLGLDVLDLDGQQTAPAGLYREVILKGCARS